MSEKDFDKGYKSGFKFGKEVMLDKVKQAREEIEDLKPNNPNFKWYKGETIAINKVLTILDKLIAESET